MNKNLQETRKDALMAYKKAKTEFLNTVTRENIKGDTQKWAKFCDTKLVCMRLGVRI